MTTVSNLNVKPDDLEASRKRQEKRLKDKNRRRSRKIKNLSGAQPSFNSLADSKYSSTENTCAEASFIERETQTDSVSSESENESTIVCNVNGVTIYLHFKNSGNNDASEIGTYLQEKLDILEFIQMDCSRMETSIVFPAVKASDPAPTVSLSRRVSSGDPLEDSERSFIAADMRRLRRTGYFIGTPSAAQDFSSLSRGSENEAVAQDDALQWETDSMMGTPSSSKRRSTSVSSVSSVESARSWKRPSRGVFGRSRMSRLLADLNRSDVLSDKESNSSSSPREAGFSSWWASNATR